MSSVLYHLADVDLDDCVLLYLKIDQSFNHRSSSPHAAQYQICRTLLSSPSFGGCLISPQRDLTQVAVVGKGSILNNAEHEFQTWLRSEHLMVISCENAQPFAVEECARFTLAFWLESQNWYRVGDSLVQAGFLSGTTRNLSKIIYQVHCASSGRVFLRISSQTVRFFILEQWQLTSESPNSTISIEPRWATCLPKLGRGRVIALHRGLPAHSPFATYRQMQAYWKNCYGYDLPSAEPEVYYDVLFNGMKEPLLYPFFCVLAGEPEAVCFRDDKHTTEIAFSAFTKALMAEDRILCGRKVQVADVSAEEYRLQAAMLTSEVRNKQKSKIKKGNYRPSFGNCASRDSQSSYVRSVPESSASSAKKDSIEERESHAAKLSVPQPAMLSTCSSSVRFRPSFGTVSRSSTISKEVSSSKTSCALPKRLLAAVSKKEKVPRKRNRIVVE